MRKRSCFFAFHSRLRMGINRENSEFLLLKRFWIFPESQVVYDLPSITGMFIHCWLEYYRDFYVKSSLSIQFDQLTKIPVQIDGLEWLINIYGRPVINSMTVSQKPKETKTFHFTELKCHRTLFLKRRNKIYFWKNSLLVSIKK